MILCDSDCSSLHMSKSPEVSSPADLAVLPTVSPGASTPNDLPNSDSQFEEAALMKSHLFGFNTHADTSHTVAETLSISSTSTMPYSPGSFETSPQDQNYDYSFSENILAVKLPDSPGSQLSCMTPATSVRSLRRNLGNKGELFCHLSSANSY
jgi:hypothetical protein